MLLFGMSLYRNRRTPLYHCRRIPASLETLSSSGKKPLESRQRLSNSRNRYVNPPCWHIHVLIGTESDRRRWCTCHVPSCRPPSKCLGYVPSRRRLYTFLLSVPDAGCSVLSRDSCHPVRCRSGCRSGTGNTLHRPYSYSGVCRNSCEAPQHHQDISNGWTSEVGPLS